VVASYATFGKYDVTPEAPFIQASTDQFVVFHERNGEGVNAVWAREAGVVLADHRSNKSHDAMARERLSVESQLILKRPTIWMVLNERCDAIDGHACLTEIHCAVSSDPSADRFFGAPKA
jgi:hypothetical protein